MPLFLILFLILSPILITCKSYSSTGGNKNVSAISMNESSDGNLKIHFNAVTHHFKDKDSIANETNWGLGIQKSVALNVIEQFLSHYWTSFWELDIYQDSYYDMGISAGIGSQRPLFRYLDFGLKTGLIYEAGLKKDNGSPLLPYLLPFVETNFESRLNARITVVPPISDGITGIVTLQLIWDI